MERTVLVNNKISKEANKSFFENSNFQNEKPLPLWHDYVFKRVFAYEENESVLKDFLEGILNIKIDTIEVKNPEIIKAYQEGKKSILDIKVVINDGTIIR